MLSQIVRPMVRTQIHLLANSQAIRVTLINTIAQWLGFLGVRAQVTHLDASAGQIHVSLSVCKPEACEDQDWQRIISNLTHSRSQEFSVRQRPLLSTPQQKSKLQRLLAYLIQVAYPDGIPSWEVLAPQLNTLDLDEEILLGIRAALKVPQSLDHLVEGLDADIAAIALPKAVGIALLDQQVNSHENRALSALMDAIKQPLG